MRAQGRQFGYRPRIDAAVVATSDDFRFSVGDLIAFVLFSTSDVCSQGHEKGVR
jgi:hypothetical protein